jgi:hypothetical protein
MDLNYAIVALISDPNKLTAVSTSIIAAFTVVLVGVSYSQSRLIRKSIELTKSEFIATHRPRIIVRLVQGPFVEADAKPQFVWVTIANIGVTKATVLEWGADLARRKGRNWITPGLDAGPKVIDPIVLVSGRRHSFTVAAKIPYDDAQIFSDVFDDLADSADKAELCAVGVIRYADESNIVRETGFFRVYHTASETLSHPRIPERNTKIK